MLTVYTKSEKETLNLGYRMGRIIFSPSLVALIGELGSGKTTLIRGIAKGMGIQEVVKSPSFVIINEYSGSIPLYHFDLYRIDNPQELNQLGYQEYFYTERGVVVIEWADKILPLLPSRRLEIKIKMRNFCLREVVILPRGREYCQLVERIKGEPGC
jgi:tRNA threonylcarbamoyladenosine biosynthesis protein TsaE